MKIIIETTYTNVDQEFADWWATANMGMTGGKLAQFMSGEKIIYSSKDPTSDVVGTTTYTLIAEEDSKGKPRER